MTPSTTHPYGAPLAGFVHQHFSLSAKILNLFRQDLEQHLSCHLLKLEAETIAQKIEHLVLFENYLTQPLKTILRVSKKKEKVPFSYYLTFQEDSLGILPILPTNISLIGEGANKKIKSSLLFELIFKRKTPPPIAPDITDEHIFNENTMDADEIGLCKNDKIKVDADTFSLVPKTPDKIKNEIKTRSFDILQNLLDAQVEKALFVIGRSKKISAVFNFLKSYLVLIKLHEKNITGLHFADNYEHVRISITTSNQPTNPENIQIFQEILSCAKKAHIISNETYQQIQNIKLEFLQPQYSSTLHKFNLHDYTKTPLMHLKQKQIIMQSFVRMANTLIELEKINIRHADFKPTNIFLNQNPETNEINAYLADFDLIVPTPYQMPSHDSEYVYWDRAAKKGIFLNSEIYAFIISWFESMFPDFIHWKHQGEIYDFRTDPSLIQENLFSVFFWEKIKNLAEIIFQAPVYQLTDQDKILLQNISSIEDLFDLLTIFEKTRTTQSRLFPLIQQSLSNVFIDSLKQLFDAFDNLHAFAKLVIKEDLKIKELLCTKETKSIPDQKDKESIEQIGGIPINALPGAGNLLPFIEKANNELKNLIEICEARASAII